MLAPILPWASVSPHAVADPHTVERSSALPDSLFRFRFAKPTVPYLHRC